MRKGEKMSEASKKLMSKSGIAKWKKIERTPLTSNQVNKNYWAKHKEKEKARLKEWRKKNKDYANRWYAKNKDYWTKYYKQNEKIIKSNYLKNSELIKSKNKAYAKKNPEVYRNCIHKRRAACSITDIDSAFLDKLRKNTIFCVICNKKLENHSKYPDGKHLDHITPLNVGGTHTKNNVRYICALCNCKRPRDGSDVNKIDNTIPEDLLIRELPI